MVFSLLYLPFIDCILNGGLHFLTLQIGLNRLIVRVQIRKPTSKGTQDRDLQVKDVRTKGNVACRSTVFLPGRGKGGHQGINLRTLRFEK